MVRYEPPSYIWMLVSEVHLPVTVDAARVSSRSLGCQITGPDSSRSRVKFRRVLEPWRKLGLGTRLAVGAAGAAGRPRDDIQRRSSAIGWTFCVLVTKLGICLRFEREASACLASYTAFGVRSARCAFSYLITAQLASTEYSQDSSSCMIQAVTSQQAGGARLALGFEPWAHQGLGAILDAQIS